MRNEKLQCSRQPCCKSRHGICSKVSERQDRSLQIKIKVAKIFSFLLTPNSSLLTPNFTRGYNNVYFRHRIELR